MKNKRIFVASTWLLTIVFPALVVIGELVWGRLKLNPIAFKLVNVWDGTRMTRLIIAALPYLVLALFTQYKLKKHPIESIYGGLIAADVAVIVSSFFAWGVYFMDFGSGGGANMAGALVFLSPVCIPIFMLIGYVIGKPVSADRKKGGFFS